MLEHKLNFDHSSTIQCTAELEEQLSTAAAEILKLEAHVKKLKNPESEKKVDFLVKNIRLEANRKLCNYQQDTEAKFSKQVCTARSTN